MTFFKLEVATEILTSLQVVEVTRGQVGVIRAPVGATTRVAVVVVITRVAAVEVGVIKVVARTAMVEVTSHLAEVVDTNSKLLHNRVATNSKAHNRIATNNQTISNNRIRVMVTTSNNHRQQLQVVTNSNRIQLDINNRVPLVMINTNRTTNNRVTPEHTSLSKRVFLTFSNIF